MCLAGTGTCQAGVGILWGHYVVIFRQSVSSNQFVICVLSKTPSLDIDQLKQRNLKRWESYLHSCFYRHGLQFAILYDNVVSNQKGFVA